MSQVEGYLECDEDITLFNWAGGVIAFSTLAVTHLLQVLHQ